MDETVDWDEILGRLRAQADAGTPEAWIPEESGDELLGVLVAVNPAVPTRYGSVPVATIARPSGELRSLWLMHAVLRREFERQAPAIGEYVLIRYQGPVHREGGGSSYESYAVLVDRPKNKSVDWSSIAARYGDDVEREPSPPPQTNGAPLPGADADDIPF